MKPQPPMATQPPGAPPRGDGAWRTRSAEQTLDWLMPIARQLGVTRLGNITGLDRIGVPVWLAVRPSSRALATSQGKGLTHAAAKAGAVMESVETWHAEHYSGALVYESAYQLAGRRLTVPLERLPRVAGGVLAQDEPMLWASGTSLDEGSEVLVPWECVSLNTTSSRTQRRTFIMSSNGLAGGNTEQEALLQAVQELVERHCIAAWRRRDAASVKAGQVDTASITDASLSSLLSRVQPHALVGLWDMAAVPGIPAFACLLVDRHFGQGKPVIGACSGFGVDCDPVVAASKAVLEAIQSRATLIAGSRDDIDVEEQSQCRNEQLLERMTGEIEFPNPTMILPEPSGHGMGTHHRLNHMLEALRTHGIGQIVKVDLSKPDWGVPVVKLIAPQLEQPSLSSRNQAKRN